MLAELIELAESAEQQAAEARQKRIQEESAAAREAICFALDPLWTDELAPHVADEKYKVADKYGQVEQLEIKIERPDLAPFSVEAHKNGGRWHIYLSIGYQYKRVDVSPQLEEDWPLKAPAVLAFFKERRDAHLERVAEEERRATQRRQQQVNELAYKLTNVGYRTPEDADENVGRLIELQPDNEAEWMRLRQEWQGMHDEVAAKKAAHEQKEKQKQAVQAAYEAAVAKWREQCQAVVERNRERLAPLQEKLNRSFVTWEVCYGIVAREGEREDGEQYVETETAVVLSREPDRDGFWPVINSGGRVYRRKFFNLVSQDAAQEVWPVDAGRYTPYIYVPEADTRLYFHPGFAEEEVRRMVKDAGLEPYPEHPEEPECW